MSDGSVLSGPSRDEPEDGREPWERCGCPACQVTMTVLYGLDELPEAETTAPQDFQKPEEA